MSFGLTTPTSHPRPVESSRTPVSRSVGVSRTAPVPTGSYRCGSPDPRDEDEEDEGWSPLTDRGVGEDGATRLGRDGSLPRSLSASLTSSTPQPHRPYTGGYGGHRRSRGRDRDRETQSGQEGDLERVLTRVQGKQRGVTGPLSPPASHEGLRGWTRHRGTVRTETLSPTGARPLRGRPNTLGPLP